MKLYQAGYYRLGRRGSGSGWNIVAPSVGMSEIAKAGFKGIAARLADLKQMVQAPPEAMGIFQHDRFVYLQWNISRSFLLIRSESLCNIGI